MISFQTKIQAITKELSTIQSEKCHLEKQLEDLNTATLSLKENFRIVSEEKKHLCNLFDLEKSKSAKLEHDLTEHNKNIASLQSKIEDDEKLIETLKVELEQLKNNSNVSSSELWFCFICTLFMYSEVWFLCFYSYL